MNILGDTKIYLTEKDLVEDELVLNILILLGDIKIYIPDNVDVICNVIPILGGISTRESSKSIGKNKK